jgi:serine/threonine-protein kinase
MVGRTIDGRYEVERVLGEGGMGLVYRCKHIVLGKPLALKVLRPDVSRDEEIMTRFRQEAQSASSIGNQHIIDISDFGSLPDGSTYFVMEYLDGSDLTGVIEKEQPLSVARIIHVGKQFCQALGAAHGAGIVHRDLKPDNIYVLKSKAGQTDFVKIIDFGISKFQPLSGDGMKMTRTGAVMGTPYYMSPEQASGSHEADQRSDLYSMGVIMFEAVTGQVPFDGTTFNQLMFKIVLSDVPRPESLVPDLDPAFATLIMKAMARDPAQRFQSAEAFVTAIDGWLKSGTAVSIPPTADPAAAALIPSAPRPAMAAAPGPGTAGSWAKSSEDEVPLKKGPSVGLVAGLAVGLLLLGGGVAYAILGGKGSEAADAAALSAAVAAEPPTPAATEVKPKEPPPTVAPAPEPAPSPGAPASAAPPAAASAAPPAPVRPATRPGAARPTPAKPTPAKPSQKSGSTPDFGY